MDATGAWKTLFEGWPGILPRQGMVVALTGENIPFINFMISGGLLLLERDKPDQYGTRKVILPYTQIACLRLSTTEDLKRFHVMGFQSPL